ncbi:uncharacterized protein LOC106085172 [Stomoxys calcitrans]|uniref:uncharacterized protein LOC106085172 n=1 Tax=Stomoxys calcitrans TaxID=35570 RepID=UPI0027E3756C|nr:uncharacterized protein LOC106085172 [Stomoxys calcitrans]XP_013104722.2 uncharacterized protein LOC106085172 [Stomoxys calcitrans]
MISNLSNWKLLGALALISMVANSFAADVDCSKKPPKVDPMTCCALPHLITDEIMEKCKSAIPPPPSPPPAGQLPQVDDTSSSEESKHHHRHHHNHHGPHHHGMPMHPCFMTCVLNETGILLANPEAKLNEENLKSYLKVAMVNATDLIPTMETSFKTCAAKGEEMRAKMKEMMEKKMSSSTDASVTRDHHHHHHHHGCTPCAAALMGCVFMESFVNCPSTLWSNTNDCIEMREHMRTCKPPKFHGKWDDSNSLDDN